MKTELSNRDESRFVFSDPPAHIEATVTRADFESWIAEDVREIEACVERLFARTRIETRQVDRVFLTGGSSFVPAVRAIFERRFGRERTRTGGELISVASGLALRALDER